jgi:hypothetical protein
MFDLNPNERTCLRALLDLLAHGERLAADCAAKQATLCDGPLARYFRSQSRQERLHALVFDAGRARLGGGSGEAPPMLARYRARVEADLAVGDLAGSVVATQVVLEALGHAVLTELEQGLVHSRSGFEPICRLLLRQEQAHHVFGLGFVARRCDPATLSAVGTGYTTLARELIAGNEHLLDGLGVEPSAFRAAFESALPAPLRNTAT